MVVDFGALTIGKRPGLDESVRCSFSIRTTAVFNLNCFAGGLATAHLEAANSLREPEWREWLVY